MLRAYKYRLYPNKAQEEYFAKCFGCVRFIYNRMLSDKIAYYQENKRQLYNTPAQYKDEFPWLREVDCLALSNAQLFLERAFVQFFNCPSIGFPKFKTKKTNHHSYTTNNQRGKSIRITDGKIRLPRIGFVKLRQHRKFEGVIRSVTISKVPSGKYFISILVDAPAPTKLPPTDKAIGVDLGLQSFCITSDGRKVENPSYLQKAEEKLIKLQRNLCRCKIGSANREKARVRYAKQYEKVVNQRKDFLHNVSKHFVDENQVIAIEDLAVQELMQNRFLAKSIGDVSWSKFVRFLGYKCEWYGRDIIMVDRWFPSSQICSACGNRTEKKPLHIRNWSCPFCGANHDRDINAAINILNEALTTQSVGTTQIACVNLFQSDIEQEALMSSPLRNILENNIRKE